MIITSSFNLFEYTELSPIQPPVPPPSLQNHICEYKYEVKNPSEFVSALQDIRRRVRFNSSFRLWFRGQTKDRYRLLPSLFRDYLKREPSYSLPELQRSYIEHFLVKSRDAPEMANQVHNLQGNALIETLAEMQHYGFPTNLLDWSENPFFSLCFACGYAKEKPSEMEENATVYVLNPYLYNMVRAEIIKLFNYPQHNRKSMEHIIRVQNTIYSNGSILPYFGVHYNIVSEDYRDYVYGPDIWDPFDWDKTKWPINFLSEKDTSTQGSKYPPLLPLAIQVPRTNRRIHAQQGVFLAYNLCDTPTKCNSKFCGFQHIDLEEIQRYYFENNQIPAVAADDHRKHPFLFRIDLEKSGAKEFRNFLDSIGIRHETIYPELIHTGEAVHNSQFL